MQARDRGVRAVAGEHFRTATAPAEDHRRAEEEDRAVDQRERTAEAADAITGRHGEDARRRRQHSGETRSNCDDLYY